MEIRVDEFAMKLGIESDMIKEMLSGKFRSRYTIATKLDSKEQKYVQANRHEYQVIYDCEQTIYENLEIMQPIKYRNFLKLFKLKQIDVEKVTIIINVLKKIGLQYRTTDYKKPNLRKLSLDEFLVFDHLDNTEFFIDPNTKIILKGKTNVNINNKQKDKSKKFDENTNGSTEIEPLNLRATNQAVFYDDSKKKWHDGLFFRSYQERLVYDVLKQRDVLIFPLPAAVFGKKDERHREPDFLICSKGKFGILEVDGKQHELSRAKDHEKRQNVQILRY
jgi:hypothetical protein